MIYLLEPIHPLQTDGLAADRAANRVNDVDDLINNVYLYIQGRNVFRTYGTCGGEEYSSRRLFSS